ncbi:AI-2E family transporter [Oceanobacillus profundus]|uniref:AI-2E family transporter n=1 Tax=Oceanobacillus profundus TaxID=372463 RepID=A0A417YJG2_9BACI|nr:AI-2E family transporter [Oceanobacillus profundus]MBR3118366.1 AI-2E family transporter [Oceanobacillus sp.]PAE30989.1 AI-2E family transporter [Paenibacillus sp. 7884-2]MCM3396935.1 AI-2E family transporter [Oceanobacillus profundus]MDO6448235.1 AI-2E family transporter [Oceanobacillus profundus]RHW33077.1 AI-2E family transporter [Oceanobacillus profundus]
MVEDKKRFRLLYWLLIGIVLFIFSFLLVKTMPYYEAFFSFLWKLFIPFLIAALIAYLLHPLVEKLHEWNIHRGLAILLIYLIFFGGVGYLFYKGYPAIVHQVRDLNENLPEFIRMYESWIYQVYSYTSFLPETVHDKIDQLIATLETSLDNLLGRLALGFTRIFDMILIITVIPVLVFYFIKDYVKIESFFMWFIPNKYKDEAAELLREVDKGLGGYIRGQLIVSLFVSIACLIIFKLLDVNYALLLAIVMGVTNIIPYFGPIIGAIPVVMISYTIGGNTVIFVIIAIFVIQVIEGNLLSPYIMGKTVKIHPVAIIFVLLLGGQLFGVWGMILAVPALTILKVIAIQFVSLRSNH